MSCSSTVPPGRRPARDRCATDSRWRPATSRPPRRPQHGPQAGRAGGGQALARSSRRTAAGTTRTPTGDPRPRRGCAPARPAGRPGRIIARQPWSQPCTASSCPRRPSRAPAPGAPRRARRAGRRWRVTSYRSSRSRNRGVDTRSGPSSYVSATCRRCPATGQARAAQPPQRGDGGERGKQLEPRPRHPASRRERLMPAPGTASGDERRVGNECPRRRAGRAAARRPIGFAWSARTQRGAAGRPGPGPRREPRLPPAPRRWSRRGRAMQRYVTMGTPAADRLQRREPAGVLDHDVHGRQQRGHVLAPAQRRPCRAARRTRCEEPGVRAAQHDRRRQPRGRDVPRRSLSSPDPARPARDQREPLTRRAARARAVPRGGHRSRATRPNAVDTAGSTTVVRPAPRRRPRAAGTSCTARCRSTPGCTHSRWTDMSVR